MSRKIYCFSILLVAFVFSACKCDRKEIGITFVFDQPLGETQTGYPNYFKEIAIPYTVECAEKCKDILPKPISVSRLDISNREVGTNAWYFESIGENTIDFSTTWLGTYFNDSIPPSFLFEPSSRAAAIDAFLEKNKANTFIFSEESNEEAYLDVKIFNATNKLVEALQANACQNKDGKFYILVNPALPNSPPPPPPVPNGSLTTELNLVANRKGMKEDRSKKADEIYNLHFETDAKIIEVPVDGERPINGGKKGFPLAKDWLKNLAYSRTIEKVDIREIKKALDGEKITELTIVEFHRGDEY